MMIKDFEKIELEKDNSREKVKFKIFGEEMIEKTVNSCGKNGRVYLPQDWIGKKVKVVRC